MAYANLRVSAPILCALLLTGTVSHVSAQSETTPQWSSIMITKVKPGARSEYEALQKDLMAAYKKADIPSRVVLQTVFGDLNEFVSVMPISKFSDMDGTAPWNGHLVRKDTRIYCVG